MPRPHHQNTPCTGQGFSDNPIVRFARWNVSIPPNRPAPRLKHVCQQLYTITVLASITDKYVAHRLIRAFSTQYTSQRGQLLPLELPRIRVRYATSLKRQKRRVLSLCGEPRLAMESWRRYSRRPRRLIGGRNCCRPHR